jgi:hypothetical protein
MYATTWTGVFRYTKAGLAVAIVLSSLLAIQHFRLGCRLGGPWGNHQRAAARGENGRGTVANGHTWGTSCFPHELEANQQ